MAINKQAFTLLLLVNGGYVFTWLPLVYLDSGGEGRGAEVVCPLDLSAHFPNAL